MNKLRRAIIAGGSALVTLAAASLPVAASGDLDDDTTSTTATAPSMRAPFQRPSQASPEQFPLPTSDQLGPSDVDNDKTTQQWQVPVANRSMSGRNPALFNGLLHGTLAPQAPFPLVLNALSTPLQTVVPGVQIFTEHLRTALGPVVVHGIFVDLRTPGLQFRTVLAHDRMVSGGETLSSMARRTGAIAGINGDYFAIHQTNEPLGIVVRDGIILRSPGARVALAIDSNNGAHIEPFTMQGSALWDTVTVPLTGINNWPPDGGASLILPSYGTPRARAGVRFFKLSPVAKTLEGQTFRVLADESAAPSTANYGLALGPAALRDGEPPAIGATVIIKTALSPERDSLRDAIGGGPQLLADHEATRDETDPLDDETGKRFPLSGVGRLDDGRILLLAVDGRAPLRSIGLTRSEFGALFASMGAADAMCFDSGGSTTLVARLPGEAVAQVRNSPSNGNERLIGDALLIYSNTSGPLARPALRTPSQGDLSPSAANDGTDADAAKDNL